MRFTNFFSLMIKVDHYSFIANSKQCCYSSLLHMHYFIRYLLKLYICFILYGFYLNYTLIFCSQIRNLKMLIRSYFFFIINFVLNKINYAIYCIQYFSLLNVGIQVFLFYCPFIVVRINIILLSTKCPIYEYCLTKLFFKST